MNRRELIQCIVPSVAGLAATVVGVKAASVETPTPLFAKDAARTVITLQVSDDAIARAVERDFKNNGRIRRVIQEGF